ncbi:MAG TPA: hypothetical protein VHM91_09920, partial [Verrucomicrobiales bacterium]|nr:hypothetical protein [Verrucomicrobiales bacterium]
MPAALYEQPAPCNLRKADVEAVAQRVARSAKFTPGQSLDEVVKSLGGQVKFLSWEDWMKHSHDTITVEGPSDFCIRLMSSDGPLRHRFTIAHELG